jgi:hypothetical protein
MMSFSAPPHIPGGGQSALAPGPDLRLTSVTPHQASTWKRSSTRTSSSPCGMSVVRTRSVLFGGITSRIPRVLSSWSTATTAIVLLKPARNFSGCSTRTSSVMPSFLYLPTSRIFPYVAITWLGDTLYDSFMLTWNFQNAMNAAEITDKLGLHSLRQRAWVSRVLAAWTVGCDDFADGHAVHPVDLRHVGRWSLRGPRVARQYPAQGRPSVTEQCRHPAPPRTGHPLYASILNQQLGFLVSVVICKAIGQGQGNRVVHKYCISPANTDGLSLLIDAHRQGGCVAVKHILGAGSCSGPLRVLHVLNSNRGIRHWPSD